MKNRVGLFLMVLLVYGMYLAVCTLFVAKIATDFEHQLVESYVE